MKQTRTLELKIEKTETLVVRRRRRIVFAGCAGCGRETEMLTAEAAAGIFKTSARRIYKAIEAGQIHFVELPENLLLICLDSLRSIGHLPE